MKWFINFCWIGEIFFSVKLQKIGRKFDHQKLSKRKLSSRYQRECSSIQNNFVILFSACITETSCKFEWGFCYIWIFGKLKVQLEEDFFRDKKKNMSLLWITRDSILPLNFHLRDINRFLRTLSRFTRLQSLKNSWCLSNGNSMAKFRPKCSIAAT